MFANLFTWISKIVRLVLITRSAYEDIKATLNVLEAQVDALKARWRETEEALILKKEELGRVKTEASEMRQKLNKEIAYLTKDLEKSEEKARKIDENGVGVLITANNAVEERDRLRQDNKNLNEIKQKLYADLLSAECSLVAAEYQGKKSEELLAIATDRLSLISEKETPSANGTVRKMAKIAREAIAEITGEEVK